MIRPVGQCSLLCRRSVSNAQLIAAILRPLAFSFVVAISIRGSAQTWEIGPCVRESQQPIIRPDSASKFPDPVTGEVVRWEALHTFNPAAVVRNGEVNVLYRAEDDTGDMKIGGHVSRLGLAVSDDGIHFRREPEPVFYPDRDSELDLESPGGVEDPRIVEREDGSYIMTYTQWSRRTHRFAIGIASSTDLRHWTKLGPIFGKDGKYRDLRYKSSAIVTTFRDGKLVAAKLKGRYWMYWGEIEVHLATSTDLIHWLPVEDAEGRPIVLLRKRPGRSDSEFPETGPPAVLTDKGIVLLYNAKNAAGEEMDHEVGAHAYTVHEALFSADDPSHIIERSERPVLAPLLDWEKSGQYAAGTTFAEGLVAFRGKWLLFYGSADSFVGVASCGAVSSR